MKKLIQKQLLSIMALLFSVTMIAQSSSVSGVVSEEGLPLPGVNVIVKGTSNGTSTDFDGNFTLNNVSANDILVFSYVGLETKEVPVNGQSTLNVSMVADADALSEIVIVGYGTSSKRELTGAVSTVKGEDVVGSIASNPTTALQGKLAGVQVESFGGQPGGSANVFIRGVNSLSNAEPLYIVDGLWVDNMDYINPYDIEDISILKDAAAASIYGSRSANGVVLIKTNHGRRNKDLEVKFTSRLGFDTPSKELDFINGQQYTDYLNQRFVNDGEPTQVTYNGVNTDWQDRSLSSGVVENYGVSLSGGGDNSSYFGSASYFNQDGILIGSGFKRINARFNTDHNFGKFKLIQSLGVTEGRLQENNWYGWDGTSVPTLAFRNPNNDGGFEAPSLDIHGPGGVNQYGLATLENNLETTRTLFGNFKLDFNLTEDLTLSASAGIDYTNRRSFQFTPTFFMSTVDAVLNVNDLNDLTEVKQDDVNTLFEPTINYKKRFGKHKLEGLLGSSYFRERQNFSGIYGQGTPGNNVQNVGSLPPSSDNILLGEDNTGILISYFGRIKYNFDNRYILEGTLRQDSSSRFEFDNTQKDVFTSFSGAWVVSNEGFWDSEAINFLKLRVSYGELGSFNDEFYSGEGVFDINSGTSFGDGPVNGIAQTVLNNPNLTWETTKTFDIGFDMSFLNNKINVSADYYSKDIEDVLVLLNLPSTTGVNQPVRTNGGDLINKGFEISTDYRKSEGEFNFRVGANMSFNLETNADVPNAILGPGIDEDLRIVNRTSTGNPIGHYYGYIVEDRVDPTTGDFVRVDVNGDGQITADDQTIIGDPTPDFTYGLNFTGEYKGFDIALAFNGVQGNEIYNLSRYYNILWQDGGKLTEVLNSWTPTNTNTNIPRASIADPAGNKAPSSFFVEDGSYLRLKNLEIGYNFDDNIINKLKWVKDIRLSLNAQNLFVITNYSGYDPDVASTNGGRANRNTGVPGFRDEVNPLLSRGLDARAYPNARTYSLGLQVTF